MQQFEEQEGQAHAVLKEYFGYESFRGGQAQLVQSILEGTDTVGIMPTGAGKSICFQVPALLFSGITLVISPLISLMKDQVRALKQAGIAAAYFNSSLTAEQARTVMERMRQNQYKIVYIAPERLRMPAFLEVVENLEISMLTVDEAHCISQWGQDFRPSYAEIPKFLDALPKRPVVSAFTATATERVKWDISEQLGLQSPTVLVTGFDRENLYFSVQTPAKKLDVLIEFLQKHADKSGIIYCNTRKIVETVCSQLQALGFSTTRYHAGLSDVERRENQENFSFDRTQIMVATNAFGMGIDKSNVGFVVHFNMPKDIESYYQEAGRAGRDGSQADCLLLFSAQDIVTNRWMIDNGNTREEEIDDAQVMQFRNAQEHQRLNQMAAYATSTGCLRHYILRYFGENPTEKCGNCGNCDTVFAEKDVTIPSQKILSCLFRMKGKYGATLVVDVLRASNNPRIQQYAFQELSTYGICKESAAELRKIIDFLVEKGYILRNDGQYPTLSLAKSAMPVLKGEVQLMMPYVEQMNAKKVKKTLEKLEKSDIPAERLPLYQALCELRGQYAQEQNVPSYYIFSERIVVQMCRDLPLNPQEFLQISGVGKSKLENYGQAFMDEIRDFCVRSNIPMDASRIAEDVVHAKAETMETTPKVRKSDRIAPKSVVIAQLKAYDEPVSLSILCKGVNEILDAYSCHRLVAAKIAAWLEEDGYLTFIEERGRRSRVVTEKGLSLGILAESRQSTEGDYTVNLYPKVLQEHIIDNIGKFMEVEE